MKRSLILLLVVALLATMAPTIALAAELDTFMVAMPEISGKLSRAKLGVEFQRVLQDVGTQNIISHVSSGNSSEVMVVWETSNRNIAGFNIAESKKKLGEDNIIAEGNKHDKITQILKDTGNTPFPVIDGRAVGDVVFTGKAYWVKGTNLERYPDTTPLGTVEFTLHVLPVWETKVTIKDPADGNKEKESQTHEYWMVDENKENKAADEIVSVTDIPDHGQQLERRATVYNDPTNWDGKDDEWPATYGVGELVWTSSNEDVAKVDEHGRVWFIGNPGTVTITATAREEAKYPHTPKYATVTYIIHAKPAPEKTSSPEEFERLWFTADKLGVTRGGHDTLNIARFLEQYPRPMDWYQSKGGQEHRDGEGGNYGVDDDIIWSSSNESIIWICRDKSHYTNDKGPNWQECYVEVSEDAKHGQEVTITATSKNNPKLHAEIVLSVVANDAKTEAFERTAATVRVDDTVNIRIIGDYLYTKDKYVTLTSLNPDIAEVVSLNYDWDDNGKRYNYVTVKGVTPGTTQITLESSRYQFKAVADVTVVPGEGVKSVTVPEKYQNITMPLYDVDSRPEVWQSVNTVEVNVNVNPKGAWYKATWTSSDPSVAYVVYDGNKNLTDRQNKATIRAAGVGKCKITVTIDDGIKTFKRSMNITVVKAKATKLALNKTKANFYLRKSGDNTLQLIATDAKTDVEVPVTWTTSDKTIAKVNKAGLVTLKKEGTVKITATTKDGYKTEKSCTITVKKLPVKKIALDAKKANMKVGETAIVVYRISPAKAYDTGVTFKSSNKKVVSVDKYGFLTAKKAGKAEITITAKDGSGVTAKLTITVKGVADNANVDVIDVVEDDNLELTLDGIDGIDDLGNEDGVVLNANDVIELAID